MTERDVIRFYEENRIFYPTCCEIKDFIINMINLADRTYLGDNIMNIKNKKEHFDYVFEKTTEVHKTIDFVVHQSEDIKNQLFELFFKFYYDTKKTKNTIDDFKLKIHEMMSLDVNKKRHQLEELLSIYRLFQQNMGDVLFS